MKALNQFWATTLILSIGLATVILLGLPQRLISHVVPACSTLSTPNRHDGEDEAWQFDSIRDGRNYGLSHDQCEAALPGLFADVDRSVERQKQIGNISTAALDGVGRPPNMTRAMIYDNEVTLLFAVLSRSADTSMQLFIIDTTEDNPPGRPFATLLAIHRAVTAYPGRLPNIEFMFSTLDRDATDPSIWISSRRASQADGDIFSTAPNDQPAKNQALQPPHWLMPDFTYWSWVEPHVGTYIEVLRRMRDVEDTIGSFQNKTPQLMWRGNVKTAPQLRGDLLSATEGKSWADVKGMSWKDEDVQESMIPIEDLCKYKFIAGTEGKSRLATSHGRHATVSDNMSVGYAFSGRLKYSLHCNSVLFSHPLQYFQPFERLLVSSGPEQNYVEVTRDWSDIEAKIDHLLTNPDEAERIANNAVSTFRDRYLTPAAEACYWRRLIRGWASVSDGPLAFYQQDGVEGHGERGWRGVPFESYILTRQLSWPVS